MEGGLERIIDRIKRGEHNKHDLVTVSEIARKALKYMVDKNIPVIPEYYTLWFFAFGSLITKGINNPSEEEIQRAYQEISLELSYNISPELMKKIQQRTQEILSNSADILVGSVNTILNYDQKLENFTSEIEDKKPEDIAELIKELLEEIQALRHENSKLTKELKASTKKLTKLHEKLAIQMEQASLDFLTQVLSRRAFERILRLKLENFRRSGTVFSLIMIDPDNFKEINDKYGHLAGDQVLRNIAFTLKESLREEDAVARYGGDEFAVIVSSPLQDALKIAKRLKSNIEKLRIVWENEEIQIAASFGIAQAREGDTEISLINRADKALYLAKRTGKNCIKTELDIQEDSGETPIP